MYAISLNATIRGTQLPRCTRKSGAHPALGRARNVMTCRRFILSPRRRSDCAAQDGFGGPDVFLASTSWRTESRIQLRSPRSFFGIFEVARSGVRAAAVGCGSLAPLRPLPHRMENMRDTRGGLRRNLL